MAMDDWYRNTNWNERIKDAFFARLSRSRSQRDQYLANQASYLAARVPEAALELVDTYFQTRTNDFHDVLALLARAQAYHAMDNLAETVQAYKEVLAREVEFPRHLTTTYLDLPYLIASKGVSSEYEFALSVLDTGLDRLMFPVDVFLWEASSALIAFDQGRMEVAVGHAKKALEVAEVKKSGFRYHQSVGLVGKEHQRVLKKLARMVA